MWEFIENEEAVSIVKIFYDKGLPAVDACRYLIAKAAVAWRRYEGDYRDDITCVVVYIQPLLESLDNEQWEGEMSERVEAEAEPAPAEGATGEPA